MPTTLTIIFDGQCELCQWSRRMLAKFDRHHQIHFVDLHDETAMRQFPQIRRKEAMAQMIAIADDGRMARGYDGFVLILEIWPFTGVTRWIMRRRMARWLGRRIYAMIARNRYHIRWLPACGSSCAVKH